MLTKSSTQTKRFAAKLAAKLLKAYGLKLTDRQGATVVALVGELGSGKTTFVQGFAKELGIKTRVVSPTFLIFRKYKIPINQLTSHQLTNLYHVDLYRVRKPSEMVSLGFKNILKNPSNIVLIEWAEKIRKMLPESTKWIRFEYRKNKDERDIITV